MVSVSPRSSLSVAVACAFSEGSIAFNSINCKLLLADSLASGRHRSAIHGGRKRDEDLERHLIDLQSHSHGAFS